MINNLKIQRHLLAPLNKFVTNQHCSAQTSSTAQQSATAIGASQSSPSTTPVPVGVPPVPTKTSPKFSPPKPLIYPQRSASTTAASLDLKCPTSNKSKAKYGGRYMITLLPGDGIGPEMMRHVRNVFKVGGFPVDFEEINLDSMNENFEKVEEAITSIKRNGVALKGNIETREHSKYFKSRNVELRTRLDLYANVVQIKSQENIHTRHKDIDLVLIRQNTEGEYSSIEHESVSGVVSCLKVVTRQKCEQIARYAFDFAVQNNRRKISCVHKANIIKVGDGLFLNVAREVSQEYPSIEFEDIIIDNCSMQLVSNPWQFDILLLPNLYGAVLTNVACGLVGGPGLTSGANFGDEYAVFETGTRNTGKAMAGKNIANPIAMLNASVHLLQHLKLEHDAIMLQNAIYAATNEAKIHTPDLGGQYTTTDVVNFVMSDLRQQVGRSRRLNQ